MGTTGNPMGATMTQREQPIRRRTARVQALTALVLAAGIDGEAAQLEPPLLFSIRPSVLKVRISRAHPGGGRGRVSMGCGRTNRVGAGDEDALAEEA